MGPPKPLFPRLYRPELIEKPGPYQSSGDPYQTVSFYEVYQQAALANDVFLDKHPDHPLFKAVGSALQALLPPGTPLIHFEQFVPATEAQVKDEPAIGFNQSAMQFYQTGNFYPSDASS